MTDLSALIDPEDARRLLLVRSVRDPDGCLLWTGALDRHGYGKIKRGGRIWGAHRLSYLLTHGSLVDGVPLDHTCHEAICDLRAQCPHRRCIEPAHLEQVTPAENLRRGRASLTWPERDTPYDRNGVCAKGHPWTAENIRLTSPKQGRPKAVPIRYCIVCRRIADERRQAG